MADSPLPTPHSPLPTCLPIPFHSRLAGKVAQGVVLETRRVCRELDPAREYRIIGPHLFNGRPTRQWTYEEVGIRNGECGIPTSDFRLPNSLTCRYGAPGGYLWPRENFATRFNPRTKTIRIRYRSDGQAGEVRVVPAEGVHSRYWTDGYVSRSAYRMPFWASRRVLLVTEIRLGRLQAITWPEIRASGINCPEHDFGPGGCFTDCMVLRGAYGALWDDLNAARGYPFVLNPWVWTVRFRPESSK